MWLGLSVQNVEDQGLGEYARALRSLSTRLFAITIILTTGALERKSSRFCVYSRRPQRASNVLKLYNRGK